MTHQMQETVSGVAVALTQQMQLQHDKTLEVMQSGQREIVVKLNKLNISNLQKIMAINLDSQTALLTVVKTGSCQMNNAGQ